MEPGADAVGRRIAQKRQQPARLHARPLAVEIRRAPLRVLHEQRRAEAVDVAPLPFDEVAAAAVVRAQQLATAHHIGVTIARHRVETSVRTRVDLPLKKYHQGSDLLRR